LPRSTSLYSLTTTKCVRQSHSPTSACPLIITRITPNSMVLSLVRDCKETGACLTRCATKRNHN
jgi:hypothetical protein